MEQPITSQAGRMRDERMSEYGSTHPAGKTESAPIDMLDDTGHELMDRAKQLGRTTLETGTKVVHNIEDRIHEMPEEKTKRAKMIAGASAGTVVVASTFRKAMKKRHQRHEAKMSAPRRFMAKTKEAVSSK